MSIPRPNPESLQAMIVHFARAGWLAEGTVTRLNDETGKFNMQLSPKGKEALLAVYPMLMTGPDAPDKDGVLTLIWFLDYCQKKYYPQNRTPPEI